MSKKLKTIALVGGLIVLSITLAELAARYVLGLGDPPLSVTDPTIEYMFKPNQDCNRFGNRIFINQWGMRSKPIQPSKQDITELRILWFGDSVINGGNQTDHDSLATSILEKKLTAKLRRPVRVMNVSAGSWGPPNMLAWAKKFGLFDADYVIISLSSHDSEDFPTFAPLNPQTHPTEKPSSALMEGIQRYLPRYLPFMHQNTPSADYTMVASKGEAVQDSLISLVEMSKNAGAKVIVTHHWEEKELKSGAMPGKAVIQKIAVLEHVKFYSDSLIFAQSKDLFRDNIHPNNKGQKAIASWVEGLL